jgi:sulfhydrogenase subunit beta (sulfur reductase)
MGPCGIATIAALPTASTRHAEEQTPPQTGDPLFSYLKGVLLLISKDGLLTFLEGCRKRDFGPYKSVFAPVWPADKDSPSAILALLRGTDRLALDGHRATDPAKLLLYGVRERVSPFGAESGPSLLAGVKACDIKALELLDRALVNQEFADPAYQAWRERTTVLSFDCTDAAPTCHCTLVGGKPYAETGFDANAALAGDQYHLSGSTAKGRLLLDLIREHVRIDDPGDRVPEAVKARRMEMTARVEAQNAAFARPGDYDLLRAGRAEAWAEESRSCVGCGACTHICPTCYCLILNDESEAEEWVKVRTYDSCQWHGYARVASGASPRPGMDERFRHRYLCKLVTMKKEFGSLGCTGCGRCTEACPGGIDFRNVVRRLMERPPGGRPAAEAG